jgi:hypothetical protein
VQPLTACSASSVKHIPFIDSEAVAGKHRPHMSMASSVELCHRQPRHHRIKKPPPTHRWRPRTPSLLPAQPPAAAPAPRAAPAGCGVCLAGCGVCLAARGAPCTLQGAEFSQTLQGVLINYTWPRFQTGTLALCSRGARWWPELALTSQVRAPLHAQRGSLTGRGCRQPVCAECWAARWHPPLSPKPPDGDAGLQVQS